MIWVPVAAQSVMRIWTVHRHPRTIRFCEYISYRIAQISTIAFSFFWFLLFNFIVTVHQLFIVIVLNCSRPNSLICIRRHVATEALCFKPVRAYVRAWSYTKSLLTQYFVNRVWNFTKFTALVQLSTKMNWLYFEVKKSKVTVKSNKHFMRHLFACLRSA